MTRRKGEPAPLLHPSTQVRIEQALAAGRSTDWICEHEHVTVAHVAKVALYLEAVNLGETFSKRELHAMKLTDPVDESMNRHPAGKQRP